MIYHVLLVTNVPIIQNGFAAILNKALPIDVTVHLKTIEFTKLENLLATEITQMLILDLESANDGYMQKIPNLASRFPLLTMMVMYKQTDIILFKALNLLGVQGIISRASTIKEITKCVHDIYNNKIYVEDVVLVNYLKTPKKQFVQKLKLYSTKHLSVREKTVAQLLIEGKSNIQICSILQLQASTVSTFKQKVFKKLQITTVSELGKIKKTAW